MSKYEDIDFAKIDIDRQKRKGYSEAVFCECKTDEQLKDIFNIYKNKCVFKNTHLFFFFFYFVCFQPLS